MFDKSLGLKQAKGFFYYQLKVVKQLAEFKSVYPGLGFYVDGQFYKFRNGRLRTNDEQVITKLEKLSGVERVDKPEPKEEPKKEKKEQPKQKAKTKKK